MPLVKRLFLFAFVVSVFFDMAVADDPRYQISLDPFGGIHAVRLDSKPYPRVVAEFEPTRALVLSVSDWQPHHKHILMEIAEKTQGHVCVVVLCNDTRQIKEATSWLLEIGSDLPHVYFCELPLDTVWIRDFGPIFAQTENGSQVLDFYYEGTRPKDDALPDSWAKVTGCHQVKVPWTIQGGNLMTNGQGTALMTSRIFRDNYIRFPNPDPKMNVEQERRTMVIQAMMESCNLSQLAVLEPLENEMTSHVDMFATFISPSDIILAQLDPIADPQNAQILERNAERLKQLKIGNESLRVHRVPIPPRRQQSWSAYTNAIIVSDLILMPTFEADPPHVTMAAQAVYARLLPNHQIETVNMTTMKDLQGELHCLSLHVPRFADLPQPIYSFAGAKDTYFAEK